MVVPFCLFCLPMGKAPNPHKLEPRIEILKDRNRDLIVNLFTETQPTF